MDTHKEYFKDIVLKDYIDVITDYHANGAYEKLKENVLLKYEDDYAIMVRTLNLEANNFTSNLIYINEKEYNFLSKSKVYEDDILMNKIANAGSVYIMPKQSKPVSLAMNLFLIRFNNLLNQRYMYYLMKNYEPYIKNFANGTSTLTITKDSVKNLKFQVPSLLIQNKIAFILSNLDKKIELNNQINQKLESMAKTLYDYWFVQFDFPDADGKPYKSSGGEMVYSEELKREIPLGWEVEKISSCCDIVDCLHSKKPEKKYERDEFYLLQLENIRDDGLIDLTNKYYVSSNDYKIWTSRIEVKDNDILITNAGRVASTAQVSKNIIAGIGRNITAIRPKSISYTYLHLSFYGEDMRRQIIWNTDLGSFFKSLNVKGIKQLSIARNKFVEIKFEKMVLPIRRKREILQQENQKLTQLRDWLLPVLMNGQVRVK